MLRNRRPHGYVKRGGDMAVQVHVYKTTFFLGSLMRCMRLHMWRPIVLVSSPALLSCAFHVHEAPLVLWGVVLLAGAVMRSLGCVWNALCDKDVDRFVARSRTQPLANNDLANRHAMGLLVLLAMMGGALISAFPRLIPFAAVCVVGGFFYSFCKRWTYMTQILLGCVVNVGVFVPPYFLDVPVHEGHMFLFLGGVAWAFVYDTVYGLQDYQEDVILGLKGTHMLVAQSSVEKVLRMVLCAVVTSWVISGVFFSMGAGYYVFSVMSCLWVSATLCGVRTLHVLALRGFFKESVCWSLGWISAVLADRLCGVESMQVFG